jgi:hypothetical protein
VLQTREHVLIFIFSVVSLWDPHLGFFKEFGGISPTSFNTTLALFALHPKLDGFILFFLEDYELD